MAARTSSGGRSWWWRSELMARLAVFGGASLRRTLKGSPGDGIAYDFFPPTKAKAADLRHFDGALVELGRDGAAVLKALRKAAPRKPIGCLCVKPDAKALVRAAKLGCEFP